MGKNMVSLFLDSGAFSAWNQGVEVNMDEYIAFIKKYEKYLTAYANLDVIGDPVATYENQKYMESKGVSPIPVFHTTKEDYSWLIKYLEEGYTYIALGGMAGREITTSGLVKKLDPLWIHFLTDKSGMPKVKVHGFGLTSVPVMLRYPWYSVDSTSWVKTGRFGAIYVPKPGKGDRYDYTKIPYKVTVSTRSPKVKDEGQHFSTLTPSERKYVLNYIQEKGYPLGESRVTPEGVEEIIKPGVMNDYKYRDELNIIYFLDLERSFQKWPWPLNLKVTKGLGLI